MKHKGINQPRNQGPYLLGIPAPVKPGRTLSPDYSCDNSDGQKGKANRNKPIVNFIKRLKAWQSLKQSAQMFGFDITLLNQVHDPNNKGQCKSSITNKGKKDMNPKPVTFKHGL